MRRVMFSGSRGCTDKRAVHQVLEYELKAVGPFIAVHGGAEGPGESVSCPCTRRQRGAMT
jgi:hypothetical protein